MFITTIKGYFIRRGKRFFKFNIINFIDSINRFSLFIRFKYNFNSGKTNIEFVPKERQFGTKVMFFRKFLTLNPNWV